MKYSRFYQSLSNNQSDIKFQLTPILIGQIRGINKKLQLLNVLQQIYLLLSSFCNKNTHNLPNSTVKNVSPQHVKRLQCLRIVVLKDRHELFHRLFWDIIGLSQLPPVVDDTKLISFWIIYVLLASLANFTPFSIIKRRYLRFSSAVANPFTWYFIRMIRIGQPDLSWPQNRYFPDVCIFDMISSF